jgi:hypothetical protein
LNRRLISTPKDTEDTNVFTACLNHNTFYTVLFVSCMKSFKSHNDLQKNILDERILLFAWDKVLLVLGSCRNLTIRISKGKQNTGEGTGVF